MQDTRNDLNDFLRDLDAGVPISLLIAPAALDSIPDYKRVLGYLRARGVRTFYPVLPYADITLWAYYRFLHENADVCMITSACPGMNGVFSRLPVKDERCSLAPVASPLLCAATYLTMYHKVGDRLAFLSPCTLKWREFTNPQGERLLHYHLPIGAFHAWLQEQPIDLTHYEAADMDTNADIQGLTVAAYGSIAKALSVLFDSISYTIIDGSGSAVSYLRRCESYPRILEVYRCKGGCSNGDALAHPCPSSLHFPAREDAPQIDGQKAAILSRFALYDRILNPAHFRSVS